MADTKITGLTANTAPDIADVFPHVDDPAGVPVTKKMTFANLMKVVNGLTADATPDGAADYLLEYDGSASDAKKVLINNLFDGAPTQGDVVYFNGTKWKRLATGTVGQALLSGGAGANPLWGDRAANRNVLINGGHRVAQRGAGPFTSATTIVNNDDSYLIDGCVFLANGSDTCDVSQVADTDFVSGYKIRLDVETANRRFGVLYPVENRDMQDIRKSGLASAQFKVKCTGTSMSNVRAYLLSWSSTADAITSDVISAWGSAGADPTFVANWTAENVASNLAISTTVATKQIQNITVDTASVANIALLIIVDDTDATVGDFLEIGDVKVENGALCTNYTNNDFASELIACQRWLPVFAGTSSQSPVGFGAAISTTSSFHTFVHPVQTRVPVTGITVENTANFNASNGSGTGIALTNLVWNSSGVTASTVVTTVASGLTAGQGSSLYSGNANTRIYFTGAEL